MQAEQPPVVVQPQPGCVQIGRMRIERGRVEVFNDYPNGPMWVGSGPRTVSRAITFAAPYGAPPVVQISLAEVDAGNGANLRISTGVRTTSREGAAADVTTWSDTRLASVKLDWVAFGQGGRCPR